MNCEPVKINGSPGIVCSRGRRTLAIGCVVCGEIALFQCDQPNPSGKGTCDALLCTEHATLIGHNRHHCPRHTRAAQLTLGPELGAGA